MNKLLTSMVGLAALVATPALSADMPVKYKAPPVPMWSWTGCYIGGNVGYGVRRDSWTTSQLTGGTFGGPTVVSITDDWGDGQVVGGAQAGCNYQWANWVIGFELGATASKFNTHNIIPVGPGQALLGNVGGVNTALDLPNASHGIYSAAARFGYAWDRWLWYVKGGYAYTTMDLNLIALTVPPLANGGVEAPAPSRRLDGFVAGVGLEYALTDHLIGGIDYSYYGFRGGDTGAIIDPISPTFTFAHSGIRHDVQTITARLSFFIPAWNAPVYAKY